MNYDMTTLEDRPLANLRANALRLQDGPADKRQQQAAELLPLIDAEIATRAAAKAEAKAVQQAEARAARKAAAKA